MSTTIRQDQDFKQSVIADQIPDDSLERAIDWIKNNLVPEEVFDDKQLEQWAEDNGYVKEQ